MIDATIVAVLLTLITAFGSAMIGLLLWNLKTIDSRFNRVEGRITKNTERIHCIDKKMTKLGILIGLTNPDKVITHQSPLKIRENETVTEVIERYMKDDGGKKEDGECGL